MNGVIRRILLKEDNPAQRAETIMELLPTDDTLEVDARFKPADRGFLEAGMNATIKVDAYDFTIYGALPAVVTRISANTIEDSKGQAWYEVRLQTEAAKLHFGNQELEIKPGMTVQVDVISGRKSLFDYLLKPILKSRQTGMVRGHAANATHGAGLTPADNADSADSPIPVGGAAPAEPADPYAMPPAVRPSGTLPPDTTPQRAAAPTDETLPAGSFPDSAAPFAEPGSSANPDQQGEAGRNNGPDSADAPPKADELDVGSMLPGVADAQESPAGSGDEARLPGADDQTGTRPPKAEAAADSVAGESQ